MRVLASVARNHDGVPVEPVARALGFPDTTDRNKALAIVRFQLDDPANRDLVIREAGAYLLDMLQLEQPINRTLAYVVLQRLSGESWSDRDIEAWRGWLEARGTG